MAVLVVAAVEVFRIKGIDVAHDLGNRGGLLRLAVPGFYQELQPVRKQTIGKELEFMLHFVFIYKLEVHSVIILVFKDLFVLDRSRRYIVNGAGYVNSG